MAKPTDTSRSESPMQPALTEQLVELSAITGGLAHEIRNPLSTLKVNLQLLDEDWHGVEDSPDAPRDTLDTARRSRQRIAVLLEETDRLERILSDFLKYVGKRDLKCALHDVGALMRDLSDFYRPQAELHGIQLVVQTPVHPVVARIDSQFVKQAVLNLLINGQQAMEGGGRLDLMVMADGEWVRIDVRDEGLGITPEKREQVFRAYYSTKKGGTGLGLATARQIIREHGGSIVISSAEPKGTVFSIRLPSASIPA